MRRIVNASFLGVIVVALAGYVTGFLVPRSALAIVFFLAAGLVAVEREVARRIFANLRAQGRMLRHVVIVGANPEGRELARCSRPSHGSATTCSASSTTARIDARPGRRHPAPRARSPTPARSCAASGLERDRGVERRSTARSRTAWPATCSTRASTSSCPRRCATSPSQRLTVRPLGRFPVVYVEPVRRDGWRAAAKRAFDIAGAGRRPCS